jgi:hypothetical protein
LQLDQAEQPYYVELGDVSMCCTTLTHCVCGAGFCCPCYCACSILPDVPPVGDLKLNSYYVELGEISFMKEVIAYQVRDWQLSVLF